LDIIRIKIRHLKSENKWESRGSVDSNELDIEGLQAAQRNELIVPGHNIHSFSFIEPFENVEAEICPKI